MSASIKFDNTELVNTTYVPRFVKHESSPEREMVLLPVTRQNGSVRVSSRYATKTIIVQGIITGTSQANLEANIDTLKELFSRLDKNLDIDWNGATRRYVATCSKHEFDRDHFHLLFCPWTAEFVAPAGIGKDTASTSLYDTAGITATTTAITLTFAGSAQPKPIFTIDMTTVGSAQVVKLLNVDTGEYIKIDGPFTNGDQIIVNCLTLAVTLNGAVKTFRGSLPNFYVGGNSFQFIIIGDGDNQDQVQFTDNGSRGVNYDYGGSAFPNGAQSFIPSESGYLNKLLIGLDKEGTPGGYVAFLIYTDNNGIPGTVLGGGNYYKLATSSITTRQDYTIPWGGVGTRPFLTAGVKYWIVRQSNQATGTDASNFIGWYYGEYLSYYPQGKAMARATLTGVYYNGVEASQISPGRITPGDFEYVFYTYMGSGGAPNHSIRLRVNYTKLWL